MNGGTANAGISECGRSAAEWDLCASLTARRDNSFGETIESELMFISGQSRRFLRKPFGEGFS